MSSELEYDLRRRQASQRKRLKVLQMAGSCFAQGGFNKTTVEAVARKAGVSKGLVFHFFGSKQALIEAVVEDGLSQWSTLSVYRASGIGDDPLAELSALFLASFDFVQQHPVLLLFARNEDELAQKHRKKILRQNRLWRKRVEETLRRGVLQGDIREIDTTRVADIFHQLQTTLLTNASLKASVPRYDRDTINAALDIFIAGIRSP